MCRCALALIRRAHPTSFSWQQCRRLLSTYAHTVHARVPARPNAAPRSASVQAEFGRFDAASVPSRLLEAVREDLDVRARRATMMRAIAYRQGTGRLHLQGAADA